MHEFNFWSMVKNLLNDTSRHDTKIAVQRETSAFLKLNIFESLHLGIFQ